MRNIHICMQSIFRKTQNKVAKNHDEKEKRKIK